MFSYIAINQAHEQMNANIKGEGGAVGLTDNPSALLPFEIRSKKQSGSDSRYHDQTKSVQDAFIQDVCSLVGTLEQLGNHFEEESKGLIALHSK